MGQNRYAPVAPLTRGWRMRYVPKVRKRWLVTNFLQGGGVGLFVNEGLKYTVREDLSVFIDRIIET